LPHDKAVLNREGSKLREEIIAWWSTVDFGRQVDFVKFIGTHAEYNRIDASPYRVLAVSQKARQSEGVVIQFSLDSAGGLQMRGRAGSPHLRIVRYGGWRKKALANEK
jgi:hypothetical protein